MNARASDALAEMKNFWHPARDEKIWQHALTERLRHALPDLEITREALVASPAFKAARRIDIMIFAPDSLPLLGIEVKTASIQMSDARQVIAYAAVLPSVILVSRCVIPAHILASLPDNCQAVSCWRNGLGQPIEE